MENSPLGSELALVWAEDADAGGNGTVEYSLIGLENEALKAALSVHPALGVITNSAPLTFPHIPHIPSSKLELAWPTEACTGSTRWAWWRATGAASTRPPSSSSPSNPRSPASPPSRPPDPSPPSLPSPKFAPSSSSQAHWMKDMS